MSAFPLITLLFLLSFAFFPVQGCPPHELSALLTFKSTVNDAASNLKSWKGEDCCEWNGVGCSATREGRHVSNLDLWHFQLRSLRGEIDSSLFQLNHLQYLDLRGNYFHGEIPPQLGMLSSLHHLYLDSDAYDCSYDNHLKLFSCHIGDILTSYDLHWLSNLSSLEYLSLSFVTVRDKSWGSIIGNLRSLIWLDLSNSQLSGSLPVSLGNLRSLEYLDLSDSQLSGSLPASLGNLGLLTYLILSNNQLSGSLPASLGNLRSLKHLYLYDNQLSGSLPASLSNLRSLIYLDLSNNQLSGSLSLSFAHLYSLTDLFLSDNHFNGSMSSVLMLPSSLRVLSLSNNKMNGTLTEVFFQKYLKLKYLDLSHSGFSINISSTWIPSVQLTTLLLKKCEIGGPIPSWISTHFNLSYLDLSANQLIGDLPSWLWDIDEVLLSDNHLQGSLTPTSGPLRYLDISRNELSGCLPADIHADLPNAVGLILADNKFEGPIPNSVANLRNLCFLDVSNNRLTGNIPASLCNLTKLQALNLENNNLDGQIPKELGFLSDLQSLRIGKNSLQGFLPSSLRNLSRLRVLDVGANNLTGNFPHWIADFSSLHVLVVRSNNFRGNLQPEIGRMPMLQVLDLSSNFFSGEIPHSYLRLPAMQTSSSAKGTHLVDSSERFSYSESVDLIVKGQELHYYYVLSSLVCFDLSNNRLSGPLSSEVGILKGLISLNLSGNSLSGPIPPSLGYLVQLESLDLSFNNFSGRIPAQIGNLTYLAHLNLSYNNLWGRIPQEGGQMLTFDNSSYMGNPNLWGCPLQRNCSRRGVSHPPAVGVEKREEGFEFPWYWMCLGLAVGVGFSGVVLVLMLNISGRTKCFEVMDRVIERMDRLICMLLKPKHVRVKA